MGCGTRRVTSHTMVFCMRADTTCPTFSFLCPEGVPVFCSAMAYLPFFLGAAFGLACLVAAAAFGLACLVAAFGSGRAAFAAFFGSGFVFFATLSTGFGSGLARFFLCSVFGAVSGGC